MMSSDKAAACRICRRVKGKTVLHSTGGCMYASAILCRRCHHRGHFTSDCEESWSHWERPTSLEELIPADVKQRLNIITHTIIDFPTQRGAEGTEQELHSMNEVVVPKNYAELLEFLEKNNIKVETVTKPPRSNCIKAVKAWGVERGFRVVLQGE